MADIPEGFSVRLASERDADLVWQLVLRMVGPNECIEVDRTQLAVQLQTGRTKGFLVQSSSENTAVGLCLASLAYSSYLGQILKLSALFVEPKHRNKHLCTALMTAACRFARGELKTARVDCTIPEDNTHIAAVLESFGFLNITKQARRINLQLRAPGIRLAAASKLRTGVRLLGTPEAHTGDFVIRTACPSDARDIMLLVTEFAHQNNSASKVTLAPERLEEDLKNNLCNCVVAVEASSEHVIGMAVSFCYFSIEQGPIVRLENIFLRPQFRGRGAGKGMIVGVCMWAQSQGAQAIHLRTLVNNKTAQIIYRSMGFETARVFELRFDFERLHFLSRSLPSFARLAAAMTVTDAACDIKEHSVDQSHRHLVNKKATKNPSVDKING